MVNYALEFKRTNGGGIEMYANGERVARRGSGWFDPEGICLAEWMEKTFQSVLNVKIKALHIFPHGVDTEIGRVVLHGLEGKAHMLNVAQIIGIKVTPRNGGYLFQI